MGLKINLHIKTYELVSIIRNQPLRPTLIKGESETDHRPINVCPLFTDQESQKFFALTHLFDVVLSALGLVDLPSNFPA